MNIWVSKLIAAVSRLPDGEQEALAREALERLEADRRWRGLFGDARSEAALSALVKEALAEEEAGEAFDFDPSDRLRA